MSVRWITIAMLVGLAGCASSQKNTENLLDISTRYQEGLRWQRWEEAAAFVPPAEREGFLDERDELADDLKIDDYEVVRVKMGKGQATAKVQVKYSWHLDSKGIVHETVVEQLWVRKGKTWLITREERRRGEKMPGVAEAEKKKAADADAEDAGEGEGEQAPEAPEAPEGSSVGSGGGQMDEAAAAVATP